jgi:polysaccharide biosynthesis transport protein
MMDVRDVGGALWRQRLLVLLVLVISGAAVSAGLWLAPKSYTATATVAADKNPAVDTDAEELDELRATIGALATSRAVVLAVQAGLEVERSLAELVDAIEGEWVEGTILVRITAEDSDPEVAADIANLAAGALPDLAATRDAFDFETTSPAEPPRTFASPDLRLVVGVAVIGGVLLAVTAAVLRDRRVTTVDDAAAAEEAATAPLLAHLPPPRDPTSMPTLQPGTAAADRFRHIRMALEADASAGGSSKVVVAGVTGGDATVWLAANVAIALASVGRRVLLVDGRMGERFGRPVEEEPDTPGLYDVLSGVPLESAVSPGPVELLSVLPSGNWGEEPVAALLQNRFDAVMDRAAQDYDVLIVLAPPLDAGDDARVMAAGGALLLAVPQGGVSSTRLRTHADRVRSIGARLLGVVLIGRRAEAMAA